MAREALGVVGAAAGFVIGAPFGGAALGAAIGFNVGYSVGAYLDPVKVPHPGLSDAPIQTSRDGVPIAIIYALHYCHGNVLQKNPEEIVTTTTRQGGKGGGSTEVEEKQRFRTFAIGVCEGPVAGIQRIWENNKLVYDTRSTPAIPAAETAAFAENLTIYLGDEDQLPDAELEAYWGTDETPAYRGLCYIVLDNKNLTDFGGAIPQYAFEVNGSSDGTVTSKPYPIEAVDGVEASISLQEFGALSIPIDGADASITPQSWEVDQILLSYDAPAEGVDAAITPQSWEVDQIVLSYDAPAEGVDAAITPQSWVIDQVVIQYDYEEEGVDASITLNSWTVTTP